jgi:transposase-like protein
MANALFDAPHFHNEEAAFAYVEGLLWPEGPTCPHCGAVKDHIGRLTGKTARAGLRKCYACRKQFTVRIGTIFEDSHLALHLWLQAIHLLTSSKKGISTRQIQRLLNCSMKTAWFLTHRIREIMGIPASAGPMGGKGTTVEIDETYIGPKQYIHGRKAKPGPGGKSKVIAIVERGGQARTFKVDNANTETANRIIRANVAQGGTLMTDESGIYKSIGSWAVGYFKDHGRVMHSAGEYVRYEDDRTVHTNSVEGFFSVFKRGMTGVYQQCAEKHLQRYVTEFAFRHSNREKLGVDDKMRADRALVGAKGKRLTYRTAGGLVS